MKYLKIITWKNGVEYCYLEDVKLWRDGPRTQCTHSQLSPVWRDDKQTVVAFAVSDVTSSCVCTYPAAMWNSRGTAEPSSSSGSGGHVERPPCSPVTQRYRVTASLAQTRRTGARAWQSWGIPLEHAQSTGLIPGHEPLLGPLSLIRWIPKTKLP